MVLKQILSVPHLIKEYILHWPLVAISVETAGEQQEQ